jgi:tRNA-intron endonuclease
MQGRLEGDVVRLPANARERFYDSRGYGRPDGDALRVAPVEAAHLLARGDVDAVDGMGFRAFLAAVEGLATRYFVYADLRDRGFYLSPARAGWVDDPGGVDLVVYPRGEGPWDDAVEYRVRVVGEREAVPADDLGDVVLAVVDEESELTYLETARPGRRDGPGSGDSEPTSVLSGSSDTSLDWRAGGTLLDDRVVVWEPPEGLYDRAFYGQRLDGGESALQLSLVEAAYLADNGVLALDGAGDVGERDGGAAGEEPGRAAVIDRGRAVEGERFDRRLRVYAALRDRGVVPKTGFKFGADFRTYAEVTSVDDLGHSEYLVRVLPAEHVFAPRELSLDVRLAHGVRKRIVFALTDGDDLRWLSAGRLTP